MTKVCDHCKGKKQLSGIHGYAWMLPCHLKAGDKFAQLMFVPVIKAQWDVVEEFSSETERGQGGFGHTGR